MITLLFILLPFLLSIWLPVPTLDATPLVDTGIHIKKRYDDYNNMIDDIENGDAVFDAVYHSNLDNKLLSNGGVGLYYKLPNMKATSEHILQYGTDFITTTQSHGGFNLRLDWAPNNSSMLKLTYFGTEHFLLSYINAKVVNQVNTYVIFDLLYNPNTTYTPTEQSTSLFYTALQNNDVYILINTKNTTGTNQDYMYYSTTISYGSSYFPSFPSVAMITSIDTETALAKQEGYEEGKETKQQEEYNRGYLDGQNSVREEGEGFLTLVGGIAQTPITILTGLSGLTFLNTPILSIVLTLLFLVLALALIKRLV